ncbi:hypothetical protein P4V58_11545 [Bacillus wiedmannii]|uniref:hypothetical protein n=1 Tax=Bacillus wiedmannii TaxID=1890302 RepID=UPI002E229F2E|nr:hypothetical protein [Bacillus wiedmannii]
MKKIKAEELDSGQIQFIENFIPGMKAGKYKITVNQSLYFQNGDPVFPDPLSIEKKVNVEGTRFTLDPSDIEEFPKRNSTGNFETVIPKVVFTRPTLPWERGLGIDWPKSYPWMALLVFLEDELEDVPEGGSIDTKCVSMTVESLLKPSEEDILVPDIDIKTVNTDQHCQTITMSMDTFRMVMPCKNELPYLACGAKINMSYKETLNGMKEGTFSHLVSNRFGEARNGVDGTKNIVHLVSLEGFQDYLEQDIDKSKVRMVSLASWSFNCLPEPLESFDGLLTKMASTTDKKNLLLRLSMPPNTLPDSTEKRLIEDRLESGYLPIAYHSLSGEDTYAWYRGPFTPHEIATWELTEPSCPLFAENSCGDSGIVKMSETFTEASAVMIYDEKNGLFDHSYAVAWNLGRSKVLSDPQLGYHLYNLRRRGHKALDQMYLYSGTQFFGVRHQVKFKPVVSDADDSRSPDQISQEWVEDRLKLAMGSSVAVDIHDVLSGRQLLSNLKPKLKLEPLKKEEYLNENPVEALKKLYKLDKFRQGIHGDLIEDINIIAEKFGELMLLYKVPLDNFVPDWRMLPMDQMRYFYIDPNWLDCLIDGALSIGVQSSRDIELNLVIKEWISTAAKKAAVHVRPLLMGKDPEKSVVSLNQGTWTGVLIRSSLISGWPRIEIKASNSNGLLKTLRMDRLIPDIMLCLFEGIPNQIEFNEPQENNHFGVNINEDGEREIKLRRVKGGSPGEEIGNFIITDDFFRRADNICNFNNSENFVNAKVLNIELLQKALCNELKSQDATQHWGSAEFALQMFRQAKRFVFKFDETC